MSTRSGRARVAMGGRCDRAVAVLERRGKFLVAEPFFEAGPRFAVSRSAEADVGDLCGAGRSRDGGRGDGRGGRAEIARRIGKPSVARDVIEALMLDRGLPRRFDPAVEREARRRRSGCAA